MSIAESLAAVMRDADAMRHLHAIAARYARLPRDSLQAREIVGDVIGDALSGWVTCDATSPVKQLAVEVRRRAKRGRRDARRTVMVCIDDVRPSLLGSAAQLSLSDGAEGEASDISDGPRVLHEVRALARGDAAVTQLLGWWERGFFSVADARRGGMTLAIWRDARQRLDEYAAQVRVAQATEPAANNEVPSASDEPNAIGSTGATMFPAAHVGVRSGLTSAAETAHRSAPSRPQE